MNRTGSGPTTAGGGPRITRGRLLAWTGAGAGSVLAGGLLGAGRAQGGAGFSAKDLAVLRLALSLEQFQDALYARALAAGRLTGEVRQFAQVVGAQEREHLAYVRTALGGHSAPAQRYRLDAVVRDDRRFITAAAQLEGTGVAAYNGQAENLTRSALAAVSRIISVEARHAAWARSLAGELPAPTPIDSPITAQQAMAHLAPYLD